MQVKLKNLGTVNKNMVTLSRNSVGTLTLWFSYETCIGLQLRTPDNYMYVVHANDWSVTTGKLLNELESDKKKRVSHEVFEAELEKALSIFGNDDNATFEIVDIAK